MKTSMLQRLVWTVPATLFGGMLCGLWVFFYFGSDTVGLGGVMRAMAVIQLMAWVFFIAPFAVFVPSGSKLYSLPWSLLYGALFGVLAFMVYDFCMAVFVRSIVVPGDLWSFLQAWPFILGCALSGFGVAAVMSVCVRAGKRDEG